MKDKTMIIPNENFSHSVDYTLTKEDLVNLAIHQEEEKLSQEKKELNELYEKEDKIQEDIIIESKKIGLKLLDKRINKKTFEACELGIKTINKYAYLEKEVNIYDNSIYIHIYMYNTNSYKLTLFEKVLKIPKSITKLQLKRKESRTRQNEFSKDIAELDKQLEDIPALKRRLRAEITKKVLSNSGKKGSALLKYTK